MWIVLERHGAMITISQLIDRYLFSGVPSNAVYDLIRVSWEKANKRSWEDLYIDAFELALEQEKPRLRKYIATDGEITLSRESIHQVLHRTLRISPSEATFTTLTSDDFLKAIETSIVQKDLLILGGATLSAEDYAQLMRTLVRKATALFQISVSRDPQKFSHVMVEETTNSKRLLSEAQEFLELRFGAVNELLASHSTLLQMILANTEDFRNRLVEAEPYVGQSSYSLVNGRIHESQLFGPKGFCFGWTTSTDSDQFFVAQAFTEDKEDLLLALTMAMAPQGLRAYRADYDLNPGHILCKIASKIQSTRFGVFELTSTQNRNIYLELGLAIGMGRPFVLVKKIDAELPSLVQGLDYYTLKSYSGLRTELGDKTQRLLLNIARCPRLLIENPEQTNTYVIAHGDHDMPEDFTLALATALENRGLTPIILGQNPEYLQTTLASEGIASKSIYTAGLTNLDATVQAVQASKFGIYRIESSCSADTYLALGLAMASARPWYLATRRGSQVPSDLRGITSLQFRNFQDLRAQVETHQDIG